jgi:hypothetical protein
LREIEERSVSGNRDIDGATREVAGELLGKQRVKAPLGLPNRLAGFPRLVRSSQPPAVKFAPANRWLELLVEAEIVSVEKLAPLRQECEELTAIFVTIVKRAKTS